MVGLGAASTLSFISCTRKAEVAPEQPCGTTATVRFCSGKTMACPTEHTTLELADGTRLLPDGPLWTAYLAQQTNGEPLLIGYTLGAALPGNDVGNARATIIRLAKTP